VKVAYAGDWHQNTAWAVETIRAIGECGVNRIVHLGDFGFLFPQEYVDAVDLALSQAGIELWFVDGNHESFDRLHKWPIGVDGRRQLTPNLYHLPRGFRWSWGARTFLAVGGACSVDRRWRIPGESWWPEEELTDDDVARACNGGVVDVLVAHDCPTGVEIPYLRKSSHMWPPDALVAADAHRWKLRRVVDAVQPRTIWHGHYHRRYTAVAELGYGPVKVRGLGMDGTTFDENVAIVRYPR
jgi:hypothetical protein